MTRLSPFNLVAPDQAILSLEARRVPWGRSYKLFARKTAVWLSVTMCMVFVTWAVIVIVPLLLTRQNTHHLLLLTQSTTVFISLGIVALSLISLMLDFTSIRASISSINTDLQTGRLDMIRLTTMREGQFILAKHSASQVRAWRSTTLLVGARLGLVIILCIWFLLYIFADMRIDMASMLYSLPAMPVVEAIRSNDSLLFLIGISLMLLAILSFGATFVLEPIWRMRGMTAAGMAVSARITDRSLATVSGVGVMFAGWMGQLIILLGAFIFTFVLAPLGVFLLPFVALACIFLVYMGFFALVKTVSLRIVARRMIALVD